MNEIATDKCYYIMDYSRNYYRVDARNQLVATNSENDATVFPLLMLTAESEQVRRASFTL